MKSNTGNGSSGIHDIGRSVYAIGFRVGIVGQEVLKENESINHEER